MTVGDACKAYGLTCYGYNRRHNGLLVCVGSGLMLATMDEMPELSWAVDLSGNKKDLTGWAEVTGRLASVILVRAWYSISSPQELAKAVDIWEPTGKLVTCCNVDLGHRKADLDWRTAKLKVQDLARGRWQPVMSEWLEVD